MRQLLVALPEPLSESIAVAPVLRQRLERVLRLRPGAALVLTNGRGRQVAVHYQGNHFATTTAPVDHPPPPLELVMACGVLKGERFDWVIEKLAELGATSLQPLQTEHGVVRALGAGAADRQTRWQAVADAALEQCGRPWRLEVQPPLALPQWLARLPAGVPILVCAEHGDHPPLGSVVKTLAKNLGRLRLVVVVGAEGGLSEIERVVLQRHHCINVSLGSAVLRAETAALAAAVIALDAVGADLLGLSE